MKSRECTLTQALRELIDHRDPHERCKGTPTGLSPMASTTSVSTADFPRGRRVCVRQDQSVGPAGTRIKVLEPAGHPSGGSHTASTSESVSAANTRSGEALMTRTAVSVRLIADAPVALIDHARAERPSLDQVQPNVFGDRRQERRAATHNDRIAEHAQLIDQARASRALP
jgi:hypothetical protein